MYDIIGDIHGHARSLIELLETLGYENLDGNYSHPDRTAIFLGDFIDRGPCQKAVLEIVMPMVSNNSAKAVMGNHEFNALAYHTEHPEKQGTWLRPRNNKNTHQHLAFLNEYIGINREKDLQEALNFFRSLPLWLDLGGIRVVHACWRSSCMALLSPLLNHNNTLTDSILVSASDEVKDEYYAIETILKGVEQKLPDGSHIKDEDGNKRDAVRIEWWRNGKNTLAEVSIPAGIFSGQLATLPVEPENLVGYPNGDPPVFFGHYWFTGNPQIKAANVACLDYSVAKAGKLVAYRWNGESELNNDNFVWVD